MILESIISQVVAHQRARSEALEDGLPRELIPATRSLSSHALIISDIRRCGKSTLLMQMMRKIESDNLDRELNGLVNGLKFFKMTSGTIVTFNSKDSISQDGLKIDVVPAYLYMSDKA